MEHWWNDTDKEDQNTQENMFCCYFVSAQIPHGLAWDNNSASVVRGHHLVPYTVVMAHQRIMLLPMVGGFKKV
jgi:hypothetical protein